MPESQWLPVVDFAAGLWILSFALSILFNSKFVDPARKKKPFSADKGEQLVRRSSKLVTVYHTLLRYHGRWILTKNGKRIFFAVQIEKTEINILQKKWGKKLFYFLR